MLIYLRWSSSNSSFLFARANTRNLHDANCFLVLIMYGRRRVRPPSSYNHQTSITPSFLFFWNRVISDRMSRDTSPPPSIFLYNIKTTCKNLDHEIMTKTNFILPVNHSWIIFRGEFCILLFYFR